MSIACPLWLCVLLLPLTVIGTLGDDHLQDNCDRDVLVAVHRRIEPAVARIGEIHFNFTGGRHYEVVEIISIFQVDRLCHSALNYVESLRLSLCVLICPSIYVPYDSDTNKSIEIDALLKTLRLAENLRQFFRDVRFLATFAGEVESEETTAAWDVSENELHEISNRLEQWITLSHGKIGRRLLGGTYTTFDPLVHRVLSMITDFLGSLVADIGTLFRAPNYVSHDMMPAVHGPTVQTQSVTVDIFTNSSTGRAFKPAFMEMLLNGPPSLTQPSFFPAFSDCETLPLVTATKTVPLEFLDTPMAWAHTDVSGAFQRLASPLQLLNAAARYTRLSNLFISVQVSPYLLNPSPACGSRLVLYDPSQCLLDHNWGGYFFHMNPLPPFNVSVIYSGKPLGPGVQMPMTDIHSIHVPSMDTQWSSLISIFKSMNHHSPDLLFISPFVGNCLIIDRLLGTGTIKPKLIYLPINPLEPPPREDVPNFFEWWREHGKDLIMQIMGEASVANDDSAVLPVTTSMWLAQCSLASTNRILRQHGYLLLQVEHTYAVFLWRPLHAQILGSVGADESHHDYDNGGSPGVKTVKAEEKKDEIALHKAWLEGWQCSPYSRYLFDLEVLMGTSTGRSMKDGSIEAITNTVSAEPSRSSDNLLADQSTQVQARGEIITRAAARQYAISVAAEAPTLRYFLERTTKNENTQRGHCAEGLCECFPPFRGELCEYVDPARMPQTLRAAIHYITTDMEHDLVDIKRSLVSVWASFNHRHDYPIIIFHDGLSSVARQYIVDASENRVWFSLIPKFKEVPAEWSEAAQKMAPDFSIGYRAMIRWRSGPIFLEPVLAGFDYAMTLDTDSYFPGDLGTDPFEFVHNRGLIGAFPHLGRESASVVVNFMHYFLLYCKIQGFHPRRTRMLASLIERNFKWYQQCMMLDIEILRLDWFRGGLYQDMFRYMDSTGGFWLHRWGNNPFRTFAVALLLEDHDVQTLSLPYAHQDYCSCGPNAPPCRWDSQNSMYRCSDESLGLSSNIAAADLDEGLLDLQPWRGTERQKSRFEPQDVFQFVEEQFPR